MPTPEFVSLPEWFKMRCVTTANPPCATCPREFLVQANAVRAIHRMKDGRAMLLLTDFNYCPMPECEGRLSFIETAITWDEVLGRLNGKILDVGGIEMVQHDTLAKG